VILGARRGHCPPRSAVPTPSTDRGLAEPGSPIKHRNCFLLRRDRISITRLDFLLPPDRRIERPFRGELREVRQKWSSAGVLDFFLALGRLRLGTRAARPASRGISLPTSQRLPPAPARGSRQRRQDLAASPSPHAAARAADVGAHVGVIELPRLAHRQLGAPVSWRAMRRCDCSAARCPRRRPAAARCPADASQEREKVQAPALDHFCRDLTQLAAEGALDPTIGGKRKSSA